MRVLILALENLQRDFRVQKQIKTLSKHYDVTVAAFSPPIGFSGSFIRLEKRRSGFFIWLKRFVYWKSRPLSLKQACFLRNLVSIDAFDIIVCNDVKSLPLGVWIKSRKGGALILDAHEYAPDQGLNQKKVKMASTICSAYRTYIDGATTVSEGIAKLYLENFGIKARFLPNVPFRNESHKVIKENYSARLSLVCHGICAANRGIIELLDLAENIQANYDLALMLVPRQTKGGQAFYGEILQRSEGLENVTILEPVPADQVVHEISKYDAGIFMMPGSSLNKVHCLPNKFFDFLQAGLAIFIGPDLIEIGNFVERHQCGAVSVTQDTQSMANLLNSLERDEIYAMKKKSRGISENWCYEKFENVLLSVVEDAVSSNRPTGNLLRQGL